MRNACTVFVFCVCLLCDVLLCLVLFVSSVYGTVLVEFLQFGSVVFCELFLFRYCTILVCLGIFSFPCISHLGFYLLRSGLFCPWMVYAVGVFEPCGDFVFVWEKRGGLVY